MFLQRSERVGHGRVACEVDGRAHEIPTDMGADLTAEPAGRFEIRDFGHQLFGGAPGDDLLDQAQDGEDADEAALSVHHGEESRPWLTLRDRKSTRLNSSHGYLSYAV